MLVQAITIRNNNNNYPRRNNNINFRGELGVKVLNEIKTKKPDPNGIAKLLEGLGLAALGAEALSALKDIISEFSDKILILDKREKELDEKENALINAENLIKQSEIERIYSSARVLYGADSSGEKVYESIGEQCLQISSAFAEAKNVKVSNLNSDTLHSLAKAMQDSEGLMTSEAVKFLSRIIPMHDLDVNDLIPAINSVKDSSGNIDMDKCAHYIALYSLNNSTLKSVTKSITEYYGGTTVEDTSEEISQIPKTEGTNAQKNNTVIPENVVVRKVSEAYKYTIDDAMHWFTMLNVPCLIKSNDSLRILGSYISDPKNDWDGNLYERIQKLGINETELLKWVSEVKGNLELINSKVTALPKLERVEGSLNLNNSEIKKLPELELVNGHLVLSYTKNIVSLPKLRYIGGNLYIRYTELPKEEIERLKSVVMHNDIW